MKQQLDEATLAANEDFATDPLEIESDPPEIESDSTTAPPEPEDDPKAIEPEAVPATSYEAVNTYPESDPDAPSRLPPAARPCRAGP